MLRKNLELSQCIDLAPEHGAGKMLHETLFAKTEFGIKCIHLCARMTLEPGASVGPHTHYDENEIYYIISGHGTVLDNGTRLDVGPGDSTLTLHGQTHDIENNGTEPLVFLAIVLRLD